MSGKLSALLCVGWVTDPRHRQAQANVRVWKARIAIREGPDGAAVDPAPASRALAPHLCYSCHTALTSRSTRHPANALEEIPLPMWTAASLALRDRPPEAEMDGLPEERANHVHEETWSQRKVGREEMKDQIGAFLLHD